MIKLINGKKSGFKDSVYIGRRNATYGLKESPLSNRFVIGIDGDRNEVIAKYRLWLWNIIKNKQQPQFREFLRLVEWARQGNLILSCWCKPLPCHGDVIIKAIDWYIAT